MHDLAGMRQFWSKGADTNLMLKTMGAMPLHYLKGFLCGSTGSRLLRGGGIVASVQQGGGGGRASGGRVVEVAGVGRVEDAG